MKPEKQLYQWDVNQYLTGINPSAQYVDYPIGDEVIRIKSDGTRCRIPDEVLQTYGGKTCYERYPDGTYRAYSFSVLYAPKPPDYVYTAEERTTFDAIVAKADAAIEEIKRRADSGEFTPKKGVDYFTDAEKAEMMESVSDGAIGEFRNVVDTATTEYNANATEKLTTYNRNAEQKLEAYNSNHTEKLTEYNTNAETKTAEYNQNAAALQTEVDRLRGECDTLAAENRKQENRIDALIKLNKGQTYDVLPEEGETASRTAPSGAKYVGIDKVGGKSVVWNQLWDYENAHAEAGVTYTYENHFYDVVKNTTANNGLTVSYNVKSHNKYYASFEASSNDNIKLSLSFGVRLVAELTESNKRYRSVITTATLTKPRSFIYLYSVSGVTCSYRVGNIKIVDLTQMFGAGNEPATVEEFESMFPLDYYPYSEPTIISSQTDRVDVVSADETISQQITTGFPVLNSAWSAYDYIDLNERKLHQRVGFVDLGTFNWDTLTYGEATVFISYNYTGKKPSGSTHVANIICSDYESVSANDLYSFNKDKAIAVHNGSVGLMVNDSTYTDAATFKEAMSGVMLYYELAEEIITDIEIPTELTDWLPVEAGGSVTFHNADESKQLAVPNAVSWVRKLDEVN